MKVRSRVRERRHVAEIILYSIFTVTLVIGANFLLRDQRFDITGVIVSGAKSVPSVSLVALAENQLAGTYMGLVPHSNRFLYPKDKIIRSAQEEFKRIKSVELALVENNLNIFVTEYPEEYLWCHSNLDCLAFIQALATESIIVTGVVFLDVGDMKLITATGWYILYNKKDHTETLVEHVQASLSSEALVGKNFKTLEYIDMRFGSKIYYKWRN